MSFSMTGDLSGLVALEQRIREMNRGVLIGVPAGDMEEGKHRREAKGVAKANSARARVAARRVSKKAQRAAMKDFARNALATPDELRSGPMAAAMRKVGRKAGAAAGAAAKASFKGGLDVGKGIPMAMIAAVHEFGSPEQNIPERPFLRQGVRWGARKFERLNRANLRLILVGKKTVEAALDQLGVVAVGEVKRGFVTGSFAPNSPETIARKGSSRPLIDTGSLRQSITHILEGQESSKAKVVE